MTHLLLRFTVEHVGQFLVWEVDQYNAGAAQAAHYGEQAQLEAAHYGEQARLKPRTTSVSGQS